MAVTYKVQIVVDRMNSSEWMPLDELPSEDLVNVKLLAEHAIHQRRASNTRVAVMAKQVSQELQRLGYQGLSDAEREEFKRIMELK